MVQIYCGDGKGKTTAAVGLAVRAAGHGIPVVFAQFLKNNDSGEMNVLCKPELNIHLLQDMPCEGFYYQMDETQKQQTRDACQRLFQKAGQMCTELGKTGKVMLVLDEILHACNLNLIDEEQLLFFLASIKESMEVILTGQNPTESLLAMAEYVSEVRKIKHPYDGGVPARCGIEW